MSKKCSFVVLNLLILLLAACQTVGGAIQPDKPTATSLPSPNPGKAMLVGNLVSIENGNPLSNVAVQLASVYRQGEDGAFVLDVSHSPGNFSLENGDFVIEDIAPGEYLIVVGDPENNNYIIYQDKDKKPVSFKLDADKTLEIGTIKVEFTP